tara:strand:+ start:53 stop:622 length:570 start_codon:yes stop_codon:yes gene_type:complete
MTTKYIVNSPCEIVHMQLGMPQEYKEQLIQESYRLKNREGKENSPLFTYLFNEDKKNKVIGSDFKLWLESDLYNVLLRNILSTVKSLSSSGQEYAILNSWMGIYKENQSVTSHTHDPAYKSFCYYISAKEPYTPMVFDDVGIEIEAITDRLIIFPSHVTHSVPPCRGEERIMIAGNIIFYVDNNQELFL